MSTESEQKTIRQQVIGYVTAAFGFVTGLAWNDAIKSLIDRFFPLETDGLIAKFIYAVVVTVIVVLVSWLLVRKKKY